MLKRKKNQYGSRHSISNLPMEFLEECFIYDPEKGSLTWRIRPPEHFSNDGTCRSVNTKYAGKEAGCVGADNYVICCISTEDARYFVYAHHLVWRFEGRSIPEGMEIDHKDRNRQNNHITNLRLCTHQQNKRNVSKKRRGSVTGELGVFFDGRPCSANKPWFVLIGLDGKSVRVGSYKTKEEATVARREAEIEYYGEFAPCVSDGTVELTQSEPPYELTPEDEKWVNAIGWGRDAHPPLAPY